LKIKNIFGKQVNKSFAKSKIDWDRSVSKPQKRIKDIVKPIWCFQDVHEELYIPNSKLRIDLINFTTSTVIEISPKQHDTYNDFFHKNRQTFLRSLERDFKKIEWCEMNEFKYIEIDETILKLNNEQIFNFIKDSIESV
jgi:hypothetical protein